MECDFTTQILIASACCFVIGLCLGAIAVLLLTSRDKDLRILRPGEVVVPEKDLYDLVLHAPQAMKLRIMKDEHSSSAMKKAVKKEFSES
jgi:hypothetical protein